MVTTKSMVFLCLYNVCIMVCWTVLAIVFQNWWIALFGFVGMFSLRKQTKEDESGQETIWEIE